MGDEFRLEHPEPTVVVTGPVGGARFGAGRPKGAKNKLSEGNWRLAAKYWPTIREQILKRAMRLHDQLDVKCALWVGERLWREPRGAPVQIDINQQNNNLTVTLLNAMAAGDLTPADCATLLRAQTVTKDGTAIAGSAVASVDARQLLADALSKVVATRQNGFHNAPSSEQSEPSPPPNHGSEVEIDVTPEQIREMCAEAVREVLERQKGEE